MGAEHGELGHELAASGAQDEGRLSLRPGNDHVSSHSTQHVVHLARDAAGGDEYHTTRLCPEYPVPSESVPRNQAEADGHTFCWTCFELEMRALADT